MSYRLKYYASEVENILEFAEDLKNSNVITSDGFVDGVSVKNGSITPNKFNSSIIKLLSFSSNKVRLINNTYCVFAENFPLNLVGETPINLTFKAPAPSLSSMTKIRIGLSDSANYGDYSEFIFVYNNESISNNLIRTNDYVECVVFNNTVSIVSIGGAVTTEKIRNGSVTFNKLSAELQSTITNFQSELDNKVEDIGRLSIDDLDNFTNPGIYKLTFIGDAYSMQYDMPDWEAQALLFVEDNYNYTFQITQFIHFEDGTIFYRNFDGGNWNNFQLTAKPFSPVYEYKLNQIQTQATKNDTDANLKNRANHTGMQAISTITGLQTALDSKVVKVEGMGLSANSFTTTEKNKLSKLKGEFKENINSENDILELSEGSYYFKNNSFIELPSGSGYAIPWNLQAYRWHHILVEVKSSYPTKKYITVTDSDGNAYQKEDSQYWKVIDSNSVSQIQIKLNTIEENAQVNVLESVKVNGTAQLITSKAVELEITDFEKINDIGREELNIILVSLSNDCLVYKAGAYGEDSYSVYLYYDSALNLTNKNYRIELILQLEGATRTPDVLFEVQNDEGNFPIHFDIPPALDFVKTIGKYVFETFDGGNTWRGNQCYSDEVTT